MRFGLSRITHLRAEACRALRSESRVFGNSLHFFVARRFGKLLVGSKRIVRNSGSGARDRLVDWLLVGAGADLLAVVAHRLPPLTLFEPIRASGGGSMFPAFVAP